MSESLRKSQQIGSGEHGAVVARELTVAQVSEMLEEVAKKDYSPHVLDVLMPHDIPVRVVVMSTGLSEEQLIAQSTSDLEPVYDAVVAVNPTLAVLTERLREIVASSLQKVSASLPASS
jgi:hypothetical protein